MIKKLRLKFICINMGIVTAMLAVIFTLIILFMGLSMELQWQRSMELLTDSVLRSDIPGMTRMETRRAHFAVSLGKDGSVLAIDSGYFESMDSETILSCVETALSSRKDSGLLKTQRLRYQVVSAPFGKTVIFADVSGELTTMQRLIAVCLLISAASFGCFLVISILLARWAIRPVEKAWNQQRQFVADASHELKTPLTVILTNAELLQSGNYPPEEQSRFLGSILAMTRQMRGLVESLLELARVDNGSLSMTFSRVDLSRLAEDTLLPFEPVYFEHGLLLESQVEPGIFVNGSGQHLRQVLEILLDNGAKYADPGQVVLTLRRQGSSCILSLTTPGEAMTREQLSQIFRRFYRADPARAMNQSYGLGLSIAQSIVTEHGGRIWAESREGSNTFFVQLPVL